ncbi:MAG: hydroxyacid dehydrogenase [Rhodospirillales bacterium]
MKRILVQGPLHASARETLEARGDIEIDMRENLTAETLAGALADIDALILRLTPLTGAAIDAAPKLKVVSRLGVGYDHVDIPALTRRGIPLAIARDALSVSLAEHTLMLMLGVSRNIALMDRSTRTGKYAVRFSMFGQELLGKTVLIIGLGGIGREAAKRCAAFGMEIIASGRDGSRKAAEEAGYRFVADFRDALGEADFVSLHLPANADGSALIGEAELAAMKPGACLINTARGSLVDENALHAALTAGTLRGAGLDVTRDEPPAPDNPLLSLDNVLFTPHNSALCDETIARVSKTCVENALAALDGRLDPYFAVNPEVLGT